MEQAKRYFVFKLSFRNKAVNIPKIIILIAHFTLNDTLLSLFLTVIFPIEAIFAFLSVLQQLA